MNDPSPNADSDPLRPPDWRSREAHELWRVGRPLTGACCDPVVATLVRYFRLRDRGAAIRAGQRRLRGLPELADLEAAVKLHQREQAGMSGSSVIEARLLAGQSPEDIAGRTGISAAAVSYYHDLFFDVQRRLHVVDFIVTQAIFGGASCSPLSGSMPPVLKFAAYVGGPAVLEDLLVTPSSREHGDLPAVLRRIEASTSALLDIWVHLSLRPDHETKQQPTGRSVEQRGAEQATTRRALLAYALRRGLDRAQPAPLNKFEQQIQALIEDIPWVFGDAGVESDTEQLRSFLPCDAELRSEELLRLSAGAGIADSDEIRNLKLPPPRRQPASSGGHA